MSCREFSCMTRPVAFDLLAASTITSNLGSARWTCSLTNATSSILIVPSHELHAACRSNQKGKRIAAEQWGKTWVNECVWVFVLSLDSTYGDMLSVIQILLHSIQVCIYHLGEWYCLYSYLSLMMAIRQTTCYYELCIYLWHLIQLTFILLDVLTK